MIEYTNPTPRRISRSKGYTVHRASRRRIQTGPRKEALGQTKLVMRHKPRLRSKDVKDFNQLVLWVMPRLHDTRAISHDGQVVQAYVSGALAQLYAENPELFARVEFEEIETAVTRHSSRPGRRCPNIRTLVA